MEINKPKITYAPIHMVVSRDVVAADLPRVFADAQKMLEMCRNEHGVHRSAYAIAHSQLTDQDPLRFFVDAEGRVFVNPVIVRHTKTTVRRVEGCMSFPSDMNTLVDRWNKIEASYLGFPAALTFLSAAPAWAELTSHTDSLSGVAAQIMQHEIDHMNAKYIFMRKPEAAPSQ